MDDLFQILIYIFIIGSFLASLFKKRNKPETKGTEPVYKSSPQPKIEPQASQQEEYDILKEIERMFKTDVPSPAKEKYYEEKEIESEHTKGDEWHQPVQEEHKITLSEHTSEMWEDKRKRTDEKKKAINEKIVRQAEMFEKHLTGAGKEKSDIKKSIVQKFKEPASLKEYIIFSEIIGKPKALQE